jgi:hypothetical protein
MNQAEQERLAHLDELAAEHERLRLLALLHRLTQDPELTELKRLLGGQSSPPKTRGNLAGVIAKRAVTTIAVQAAAGLLAELLVPSLGTVAGKLIGDIADAIT